MLCGRVGCVLGREGFAPLPLPSEALALSTCTTVLPSAVADQPLCPSPNTNTAPSAAHAAGCTYTAQSHWGTEETTVGFRLTGVRRRQP